jgi:hypothetical protein
VHFLLKKPVEFQAQTQEVVGCREGIPHTHTRQMVEDSPWYRPSWGRARIPQERTRIPWPRRRTIPELVGHHGEESSLSPSPPSARRHPPLPHGHKSPTRGEDAGIDRKATHPSLGGISIGVRRSRASTTGNPRLEAEKRPHGGGTREAELPPIPSPPL